MANSRYEAPTISTIIPITESGAFVFAVSGVRVKSAVLRVGGRPLSYAFPEYADGDDYSDKTPLDFFGADFRFQATLARGQTGKTQVEVEFVHEHNGAVPSLHMGSITRVDAGDIRELKWADLLASGVQMHEDAVMVRAADKTVKKAMLVYYPHTCGLRM